MQIQCEYCGQYIKDTEAACPHCGAPNKGVKRSGTGVPKTIEELLAFCRRHELPLEKMRFFIGEDYREARAFGIYRNDEGNFVVYKNKADGSRAVRYEGADEAYAVNEIYQKLKSEMLARRQAAKPGRVPQRSTRGKAPKPPRRGLLIALVIAVLLIIGFFLDNNDPSRGYYRYNGGYYYSQNDDWYYYDDETYTWVPTDVDDELDEHASDYYESYGYSDEYGVEDFGDSGYYYEEPSSSSSSWDDDDWDDDDWDWDDDWDDSGTDWDSDW